MKDNDTSESSGTDLARFDAMTDDVIDTSEIPPLSDEFFEIATWRMPKQKIEVVIEVESDVLAWFKEQGDDYQQRLAAALRLYAEAHRSVAKEQMAP